MREQSEHAKVAKICKTYLKSIGIQGKARSSSFSMGNSVDIEIEDQPPEMMKIIHSELDQYQQGHFDGMTDMYEYSNTDNSIPQTKYLQISNRYSKEMYQKVWAYIRNEFSGGEAHPEEYTNVDTCKRLIDNGETINDMVWRILSGAMKCDFWESLQTSEKTCSYEDISCHLTQETGINIEVRAGTRAGYSEIVFSDKPDNETRSSLKAASFRWSPTNKVWYGKTENLPSEYLEGATIETSTTPPKPRAQNGDKFRIMADKMQTTIDGKFADRQTNTAKRLAQANHARLDGEHLLRTQKALYAIADLIDAGKLPSILSNLNSKKAVYDLMGESMESVSNGYHGYSIGTGEPHSIHASKPESIALWALLVDKTPEQKASEELQRKIDGLQFTQIAGYFPTPKAVIDTMLDYADLRDYHTVLEPSAGSGAICDAVAAVLSSDGSIQTVECNHTLSTILDAKGYIMMNVDFLEIDDTEMKFDRVLMNPPFEKLQDIDHVKHAFSFLKAGGRLVSVMSPSPFFNSQKKAQAFRDWLETVDYMAVDLPENSFKESGTGVSTKLLIINKAN